MVPALRLAPPPASVWMTLITQVLSSAFTIGSGALKKQLASSAQEPAPPPQPESAVQAAPVLVEPMQCEVGPAPLVQVRSSVTSGPIGNSVAASLGPETRKQKPWPSGVAAGGTEVAPPPPL